MKLSIFDSCPPFVWRVKFAIWLIVVAAFIVSGCRRVQKKEISATEPNIEPIAFIADYASDAIKATAGLDVWMKTKKLELDGVVTFFRQDGSLYMTEHHIEVYPWLNSIKITAQEPQSRFVWQLSEGRLSLLEGDKKLGVAPPCLLSKTETGVSYRDYADAVLNVITAPVRFLDKPVPSTGSGQALSGVEGSAGFIKEPAPVKMEGRWYYPIVQTRSSILDTRYSIPPEQVGGQNQESRIENREQPYWSKVVFFQNRDSSLVDMIWFAKVDEKKFLAVRGYDYEMWHGLLAREDTAKMAVPQDGILVPTKIEIFTTDARAVAAARLVKIDFIDR